MTTPNSRRVLITGATGFIGSRLAARLASDGSTHVTATGRNLDAIRHLEGKSVALQYLHLLDFRALRRLLDGQDILFHAGAWLGPRHGPADQAWALNAYASEQTVRIAAANGVSRVVLVSSIAAYGPPQVDVVDESYPVDTRQRSVYGRTKAEGEQRAARAAAELDVPLVIIRPGIVYGPGSYGWSRRMVQFVQRGVPVIFGNGEGHAHPVFIENLVDGLLLAATESAAAGQTFNFIDRPVPWRDWFGYFGAMCGRSPRALPLWLARLGLLVAERLPLGLSVDRDLFGHYTNRSVYPIDRARQLLGFEPRVDLSQGMALTEEWLRRESYL